MNNRYDFVFFFDVRDGNPNGDPDAGNLPRVDPETGHGLVTDVCLKRKVRNFVGLVKNEQPPHEIYVKEKAVLNSQHERAYKALEFDAKKAKQEQVYRARGWMCENFYDVRTFGAVMTTAVNCGQVRGPIQLAFSRSVDPIIAAEHAVTRCAVTTKKEAEKQDGDNRTMGRKFTVPYALYRCHGFVNPHLADQTGFSDDDLELFWTALTQAFELDRSASRGEMSARRLLVFQHESKLGNSPAHKLFDAVSVGRRDGVEVPRSFGDYMIDINAAAIPNGVTLIERL